MARRSGAAAWARMFERTVAAMTRNTMRAGNKAAAATMKQLAQKHTPPPGDGDWIAGLAVSAAGVRRYRLYRPPGTSWGERLPLLVMLHGCGQDAKSFAQSTRMNRIAARERFLVLYPEQDRLANTQGCWNWFDTRSGAAAREVELIMHAVDQVCMLYLADRARVAVAGLSAGASMAALLATRHPGRFKALVMHSGVPPGSAHSRMSAVGAMRGRRLPPPLPLRAVAPGQSWPALMVIHGSQDRVVAANNGQAAVQSWPGAAGARPGESRNVQRGKRYPMTVTDFKISSSTVATLVEVERLGHAWSGGAARQPYSDGRGPDASRMLWSFAARQFR